MQQLGEHHLLAMNIGPGPHLNGMILPGGVKGEEFDYFHEVSMYKEFQVPIQFNRHDLDDCS
jgi:hypothetical protein